MLTRSYNEAAANSGTFSCFSTEFGGIVSLGFKNKEGKPVWFYRAVGRQPKCKQCKHLKGTLCAPRLGLVCRCGNPYIYRMEALRVFRNGTWQAHPVLKRDVLACSAAVPRS